MDKENNIVYVKTKNGIFKCYESEQMHKPIYYPIESKTNGYVDYNDVIRILNIDDLYEQVKKQKEVIDKLKEYFNERIEVCDNRLSSPFCNLEKATKERLIFSQCLEKLEELEGSNSNE